MESVESVLSSDGPISEIIEHFKPRLEQQEMARAISESLDSCNSIICEAGTGTGKTFAYLIPALMSGNKIIISTATKHLQDQLFEKDLPIITRALGLPVNLALLKGRANYLCLQKLSDTEADSSHQGRKNLHNLFQIRQWSKRTVSGDLSELVEIPEDASERSQVISSTENCLHQECDHYDSCFVFKARKRASDADVIVVNHHLLLADMGLKETGYGELLPGVDTVIFDEAHKLPDLASQFFSRTLTGRQILELVSDCKKAYFKEAADLPDFLEELDKLEKSIRDLRLAFGRKDTRSAWVTLNAREAVQTAIENLQSQCIKVQGILEDFANRGKELDNCFKRVNTSLDLLDDFTDSGTEQNIKWVETRGQGLFLHITPLDVAGIFQQSLSEYTNTNVYTSATLSANNSFKHFAGQLGLHDVTAISWESPFDFRKQALCYFPEGLPDPRTPEYTDLVLEKAIAVLKLTRGRAFYLFTSYRAMHRAADLIKDRIEYPIFVQGDAPRSMLLDNFRENHHSILLGTSSFWEGVDVRGQSLSCVIIDKLPFMSPDDPILQARMKKMQEEGLNPFMDYQIPEAIITLKQGVGRLIRDPMDYGVLMLCDPRLKTKSYGKIFLRSLPDMQQTHFIEDVEIFFDKKEKDAL